MKTIKTKIHTFCYNLGIAGEREPFFRFKAQMQSTPGRGRCHEAIAHYNVKPGDIELECEVNLFSNQWNSDQGRVFDFHIECIYHNGRRSLVMQGHYLDITQEMIDVRNNTLACGYTGMKFPIGTKPLFNTTQQALGSEYLTEDQLNLLRLLPISAESDRKPLTDEEKSMLMPLYIEAQTKRTEEQNKKLRIKLEENYKADLANAEMEYRGMLWLIDHGVNAHNCIFYKYQKIFSFGWRSSDGFSTSAIPALKKALEGFPYPYEIQGPKK